jgi:hypothetical protein
VCDIFSASRTHSLICRSALELTVLHLITISTCVSKYVLPLNNINQPVIDFEHNFRPVAHVDNTPLIAFLVVITTHCREYSHTRRRNQFKQFTSTTINNMQKRLLILANFLNHFSIISEQTIIPNLLLWAETILRINFLLRSDYTLIPCSYGVLPFLWPAF